MTNKHYVLAELVCARKRVQLLEAEIEHIEIALKFDIITAQQAVRAIFMSRDILAFTRMLMDGGVQTMRDFVAGTVDAQDAS